MKHIALCCLMAATLLAACGKKVPVTKSTADIEFETTEHDFGEFMAGSDQHFDFVFHNIGGTPLVINEVNPSCGCIKVEFSQRPVKPGHSAKIRAFYSKSNKSKGFFHKGIGVHSNGETKFVRLHVRGKVTD